MNDTPTPDLAGTILDDMPQDVVDNISDRIRRALADGDPVLRDDYVCAEAPEVHAFLVRLSHDARRHYREFLDVIEACDTWGAENVLRLREATDEQLAQWARAVERDTVRRELSVELQDADDRGHLGYEETGEEDADFPDAAPDLAEEIAKLDEIITAAAVLRNMLTAHNARDYLSASEVFDRHGWTDKEAP